MPRRSAYAIEPGVERLVGHVGQLRDLRRATVSVVESAEVGRGDDRAESVFDLAR